MSQFWNQLKDRVQARGAQANSTIGIIGGADGPTAVFVSTKPDSWLGTLLVRGLAGAVDVVHHIPYSVNDYQPYIFGAVNGLPHDCYSFLGRVLP